MKHLRLFETEAEYNAATLDLPVVSYVKQTGNVYYNGKHAVDRVLNAPLMNMCVANGWATESNDYLTYEEAAAVSVLQVADLITYEVESAWELKYFTGLGTISYSGVTAGSDALKYLYIPDTYTGKLFNIKPQIDGTYILLFPNIIKMHLGGTGMYEGNQPTYTEERGSSSNYRDSILYIPSTVTSVGYFPSLGYYKTIIAMCNPYKFGDQTAAVLQGMALYVKDEDVEAWQAQNPWKNNPSSVHPLSEYTGDPDY